MSYAAYLLVSLGAPRDHHSVFILTSPSTGDGYIYQVSGNIQTGMYFNHRSSSNPDTEPDFISKEHLGRVSVEDFESGKMKGFVESVELPAKQFDGPKTLVPKEEMRRCQEWVRDVVVRWRESGVLKE